MCVAAIKPPEKNPCSPSPCGINAECTNGGICKCLAEYQGDPYSACRPECLMNSECATDKTCLNNKCVNPCSGTCGQNALCEVVNHIPICTCPQGMTGNAFLICERQQGI